VVGNCSTGFGYSGTVVEATLVVQGNGTVVLKVQRFRPVIGKNLESRRGNWYRMFTAERMRKQLTHKEVDIFSVRMSLEFETQLAQIPNPHLRFIRPSSDNMMTVPSRSDFVASFGKFEVLYEFESSFDMFPLFSFPFLRCAFPD